MDFEFLTSSLYLTILFNFLLDYMILYGTKKTLKYKVKVK